MEFLSEWGLILSSPVALLQLHACHLPNPLLPLWHCLEYLCQSGFSLKSLSLLTHKRRPQTCWSFSWDGGNAVASADFASSSLSSCAQLIFSGFLPWGFEPVKVSMRVGVNFLKTLVKYRHSQVAFRVMDPFQDTDHSLHPVLERDHCLWLMEFPKIYSSNTEAWMS